MISRVYRILTSAGAASTPSAVALSFLRFSSGSPDN